MWVLSGHGIPRSYRHIDGFGVHTFRFVRDDGKSKLVKYHFKTKQGLASLVWSEALELNGQNPEFHRQDLFDAIESKNYPEWEVGVQIMEESDALRFGFDLNDPTKIVPVELVPITPIGKLVLNKNPTNYFAETETAMVRCMTSCGMFVACLRFFWISTTPVTSFAESTFPMIPFFKGVCFPMSTLSSTAMAGQTLSSCLS